MLAQGQQVGAAVSGGADSVCLLHALLELAPRHGWRVAVLHLNHQLRGAESQRDVEFVEEMARRLGLPFHLETVSVAEAEDNLEQAGREARRAFYRRLLEAGLVDRVAVGHTRNDQAETVAFRFLRGSGTAGLAGIRPVTDGGVVRPLLNVTRAEVEQWLRERGIGWREDSSNADPRFARNRIRHGLLPQLEREWNPALVETLAQTAEWAQGEEAFWEAEIGRLAGERLTLRDGTALMRCGALLELPVASARRLVRRAMEHVKGDLRGVGFAHVEQALALAGAPDGSGRFQAPGLDIYRSFDWIRFGRPGAESLETRNFRMALAVPGRVALPGSGAGISTELIEKPEGSDFPESVYNGKMGCVDWQRLSGSLEVRNWRPGDAYQPMGHSGEQKIKSLFQQARIPLWERRHWPVIVDGSSIVWSRQFGPAAHLAAGPRSGIILKILETGSN